MKTRYQIVVGNVGNVCDTNNPTLANTEYADWVKRSASPGSRAHNEPVTLFKDGEILKEHNPEAAC